MGRLILQVDILMLISTLIHNHIQLYLIVKHLTVHVLAFCIALVALIPILRKDISFQRRQHERHVIKEGLLFQDYSLMHYNRHWHRLSAFSIVIKGGTLGFNGNSDKFISWNTLNLEIAIIIAR